MNSIEESLSWEANSLSTTQEIPYLLRSPTPFLLYPNNLILFHVLNLITGTSKNNEAPHHAFSFALL